MVAKSKVNTPQSPDELLTLLGVEPGSPPEWSQAALLALAARQPGTFLRLPEAWRFSLEDSGRWPGLDCMLAAARAGEVIRDARFVDFPVVGVGSESPDS